MAIFQSAFNFFLPNQRRRRAPAGGGGGSSSDPTLGKVLEGIDDIFEEVDAPAHIGEFIKEDLEDAFTARSDSAPKFAPGKLPPPVKISLFGLARDPLDTLGKAFTAPLQKSWQELLVEPTTKEIGQKLNKEVWNYLFDNVWTRERIPYSLQQVVDRWIDRKDSEAQRRGVASAFQNNPGFTLMMAAQLENFDLDRASIKNMRRKEILYEQALTAALARGDWAEADRLQKDWERSGHRRDDYASELIINGVSIEDIRREALFHEQALTAALARGDWAEADRLQKDWESASRHYRKDVLKQFKAGVRNGSITGPEAQLWKFWNARNLHYKTLNFLRTYKEKGVWGVIQSYGWEEIKKRLKYSKFSDFVSAKILGPLGLNRLANFAAGFQRTLKNLTSGLVKKGVVWVLERLGLKAALTVIGGALGSILPGAGTALGAIIGAILQFVAEVVVEKLGGVFKLVGYVLAGVVGCLPLFAVGIITVISIILSNEPYPWEVGEGVAAAQQQLVRIEITACDSIAVCNYQNPLRIASGRRYIDWRVVITNTSSQALTNSELTFSQAQCTGFEESGFEIAPGAEHVIICSDSVFNAVNKFVSNTASFTSAELTASEEAVGIVIFGDPPITFPIGWPVATGCITQGPLGAFTHSRVQAIDIGKTRTTGILGMPVQATFDGVVTCGEGCYDSIYENYVDIEALDGSFRARFAHLLDVDVRTGELVTFGQQLGTVGDSHLHYEFRGLPMAEPYIPRNISNCANRGECNFCF